MTAAKEETKRDVLLELLRQNWLHARHVETQRLWFFWFFAMFLVATIGFSAQTNKGTAISDAMPNIPLPLLLLLIVLTAGFFLFTQRLEWEFHQHSLIATRITDKLDLGMFTGRPLDQYTKPVIKSWLTPPFFDLYAAALSFFLCQLFGRFVSLSHFYGTIAFFGVFIFITWCAKRLRTYVYKNISDRFTIEALPDITF